jgi:fibronectin type 3 domain-containing protein
MKTLYTYFLVLCVFTGTCQNHVLVKASEDRVKIKWYKEGLITPNGCHVYRQSYGSENWTRITQTPMRCWQNKNEIIKQHQDAQLPAYLEMAAAAKNFKGLPLIALLLKSFSSIALCKYLGIYIEDSTISAGQKYRYKITAVTPSGEQSIGLSEWVVAGLLTQERAPEQFILKAKRRVVQAGWKQEPFRYFGTYIFRKINDTGVFRQINPSPILFTSTKNAIRLGDSVTSLFEDEQLPQKSKVWYKIQGVDFFGAPTLESDARMVVIGDDEAPGGVDSIKLIPDGKQVKITWRKKIIEDDFDEYRVYRTTHNDTDFRRIPTRVAAGQNEYTDIVPHFGTFFYIISATDKSGNEALSDPRAIEVFDNEPPSAPEGFVVVADTSRLILQWRSPTETDVEGYLIYRGIAGTTRSGFVKITPHPVLCCEFIDSLPTSARNNFEYKIVAVDKTMNKSQYSPTATARMIDITPPSPPFLKNTTFNDEGEIVLQWFSNPESDLAGYDVFCRNICDSGSVYEKTNFEVIPSDISEYTDHREKKAGTYIYYIIALDSNLNRSANSNTLIVRKKDAALQHLTALLLDADYSPKKKEVKLSWKGSSSSLRGYIVYRSAGNTESAEPLTSIIKTSNTSDKQVKENSEYQYQLRAYHEDGKVVRSKWVHVKTK